MDFGTLKPLLSNLAMPLAALLLLAFFGLAWSVRHRLAGKLCAAAALVFLWAVSCQGVAVWLAATMLPQYPALAVDQLKGQQIQAIVVLGGGLLPVAPEYGTAQLGPHTAARLRYGIWLSKQSGLPLAFSGGTGWGLNDASSSEAIIAARTARQDHGFTVRWLEAQSRDTAENAQFLAPLLKRDGILRIALVTDAWHMPRSILMFEGLGLSISPAPTGFLLPTQPHLVRWLPTAEGLTASSRIAHELLGLAVAKLVSNFKT